MSQNRTNLVAGTTGTLIFQLLEDESPIDLTSITVTLLLADKDGTSVSTSGCTITVTGATSGEVSLVMPSGLLTAASGPYTARWVLTDASSNVTYCPTAGRDQWMVFEA